MTTCDGHNKTNALGNGRPGLCDNDAGGLPDNQFRIFKHIYLYNNFFKQECHTTAGICFKGLNATGQGLVHYLPGFGHDCLQVILVLEALRINLVYVLRAGRPGCEPAAGGHDL